MFKKLVLSALIFFTFFLFLILTSYFLIHPQAIAYTETTYYIHQDNIGSIVSVTNDSTASGKIDYSAYGKVSSQQTANCRNNPSSADCLLRSANFLVTERGYTGQVQDASTSLSYYNARYYDPNLSRFISADQIGGGNRYSYVSNNPISSSDPSGNVMTNSDGGGGGGSSSSYGGITPYTYTPSINTPQIGASGVSGVQTQNSLYRSDISYHPYQMSGLEASWDYLWSMKGNVGTRLMAAANVLTLGGLENATTQFNQYASWSAQNPNATFGDRIYQAGGAGVSITGLSASIVGLGQSVSGGVKAINKLTASVEQPITIYKGMSADNFGKDIVPRSGRDFDMGGGIIKQAEDPAVALARMKSQGMSLEDIALAQANYANQFSPALSWTTDMGVARDWAMKAACESGCGVIIQAQVLPSSGVYIPDLLGSGGLLNQGELALKILAEREFTTFGIFPASGYTPIWAIQAVP